MKFLAIIALVLTPLTASATTTIIKFDELQTGAAYTEAGYSFSGNFTRDMNFAVSPSLRFYGNSSLQITRIDGARFTLEGFSVLYRNDPAPAWFVENEQQSGFALTRDGEYAIGQYSHIPMTDVLSIRIKDPGFNSTNYYIFDSIALSTTSPIPELPISILLLSGLFGIFSHQTASKRAK